MRTLNEQIQRLRDVLVTCYNAIKRKGGTIPKAGECNMYNLPEAVRSIPQEHTELIELTITANGNYLPADYDADGFSKVTARFDTSSMPKVKVSTFRVTNDCINEYGRWEWYNLIDFSTVSGFTFKGVKTMQDWSFITEIHATALTSMNEFVRNCNGAPQVLDLSNFDLSKVTNYTYMAYECGAFSKIIANWTFPEGSDRLTMRLPFYGSSIKWLDLTSWRGDRLSTDFNLTYIPNLYTIVGDRNLDYVIDNDIKVFDGLDFNFSAEQTPLQPPSLRAIINGLSDRSSTTPLQLKLSIESYAWLSEADVAIATNKGWTIVQGL